MRFDTLAVHGGERVPGPEGSVVFPIFQGTVFTSEPGESYHDIKYHRLNSTPSQTYLHDKLAALEGAEAAVATSSGMAAITTILHTLLGAGDHLLINDVLYGGTHDFITGHAERLGWEYTVIDPHDPSSWEVRENTKAVLVETITNPLMRVGRLREIVEFAREHGLTSVVDNTFASPVNFRPVVAGFDLVFNSATKYLNGHSDLVAGSVAGSAELVERVRHTQNLYGGSLDPHAGYLLARSLKTLGIRVRQQNANALALATFLSQSPKVAAVNYPGLPAHPDHGHARDLLTGFGGMLSFRLAGGVAATETFLAALTVPAVAPSLGGVETLITRPAVTSHAGMSQADRAAAGITDDLVRLSVGIEDAEDLQADFANALDKI
ncbi:trans-sulfuration enzyme family protein [Actinophytocola algeriensis]|uniref:homocysteine desulfhydrase n=1 Tax=Actinophytocola algeriensis TaxID=1768010 RepID=A0A7W7Q3V2_9PSEU|nr:PLP-dependent transferase [Actinophytocola algeriensis]MBB4906333.1 cystathionine gamma-synthase/cystathionine gamma-lyase/cystathionine beta-lyase [Actinophytocola algeriensis]MBE1477814.1 cystathionine gamma-synthase/cystathionine gamma-lyase/cystathionine beta-lyase [Actinophytocola algeriensis]